MAVVLGLSNAAKLLPNTKCQICAKARRIESIQRDQTSRELVTDAVAPVDKWNADLERRKDSQYDYADRARLPQFSPPRLQIAPNAGTEE